MINQLRRTGLYLIACAMGCFVTALCQADPAYPLRPIRFVVPYVPGGGVDFVGRQVAAKLSETIGQLVFVENRPGGGTNIGSELVAHAPPDGYTLLVGGVPNTVNKFLFKKLSYDLVRDLAPVSLMTTAPNVLAVHPSLPVRSVAALIAFAKSHPGQLSFASAGVGSSNHLSGELFRQMARVSILHVPYRGGGAAVTDLLSGQVSMYFGTMPSTLPHVNSGRLRALALTGAQRSRAAPQIETLSEKALPGYEQSAWHGLFAPAATLPAVITLLNAQVVRALHNTELIEHMTRQGVDIVGGSPVEFAQFIQKDLLKYEKLVSSSGMTIE